MSDRDNIKQFFRVKRILESQPDPETDESRLFRDIDEEESDNTEVS